MSEEEEKNGEDTIKINKKHVGIAASGGVMAGMLISLSGAVYLMPESWKKDYIAQTCGTALTNQVIHFNAEKEALNAKISELESDIKLLRYKVCVLENDGNTGACE